MPGPARRAIGAFALLVYLVGYIVAAVMLGERLLGGAPGWTLLAYFAVAGVVWAAPLKPLFIWMNGAPEKSESPSQAQ